ncbi:MAG: hypothetical protein ACJA1L_002893 [Paracoccaceae bacterium]|jgi:hypothetical protein
MPQQMLRKLTIIDGKTPFFLAMLAVVLIAAGMWLNVSRTTTIDGTFANDEDQGDPYSERIVRNTVQNSLLGVENKSGSLIRTRGYFEDVTPASKRLDYHADGTRRYHSQFGAQAWVYTRLAAIFGDGFTRNPDTVFQMFRFANCLLLATCFATFFAAVLKRRPTFLAAAALMSVSSGAALFSSNLYFMYWLMFTPLLVAPLLFAGRPLVYLAAAFIFGLAQFLVRYEFATTFALMWLLPVVLARHDRPAQLLRLGAAVFAAVCASFVAAVMLHHLRVAAVEGVTLTEASGLIFEKLSMRLVSTDGVAAPLSVAFFKNILFRWTDNGFAIEDLFSVSKALILAVFAWLCVVDRSASWRLTAVWAVATYASWYVFAYQHIMRHYVYDTMLFSCSIALAVVIRLFAGRVAQVHPQRS